MKVERRIEQLERQLHEVKGELALIRHLLFTRPERDELLPSTSQSPRRKRDSD